MKLGSRPVLLVVQRVCDESILCICLGAHVELAIDEVRRESVAPPVLIA